MNGLGEEMKEGRKQRYVVFRGGVGLRSESGRHMWLKCLTWPLDQIALPQAL